MKRKNKKRERKKGKKREKEKKRKRQKGIVKNIKDESKRVFLTE